MSLRDELEPQITGYKSKTELWLDTQPKDFAAEFMELVADSSVGHSQLARLAHKYGCSTSIGAFSDWRKKQWASKTK